LGLRESFMQIIAGVVARKFPESFAEVVDQIGTLLN
jgi:hypothetical protein